MYGFATASSVNENLQLTDIDVYYNPEEFISVLRGNKTPDEVNQPWNSGGACPFQAMQAKIGAAKGITTAVHDGVPKMGKRDMLKKIVNKLTK